MPETLSTTPSINDAKKLALRHRQRGVLILAVANGKFSVTTFGHTRADCDAMRKVNEQMAALIENGTLVDGSATVRWRFPEGDGLVAALDEKRTLERLEYARKYSEAK